MPANPLSGPVRKAILVACRWKSTTCSAAKKRRLVSTGRRGREVAVVMSMDGVPLPILPVRASAVDTYRKRDCFVKYRFCSNRLVLPERAGTKAGATGEFDES